MIGLIDLKNYLRTAQIASLSSIAAHFKCDAWLLRDMLEHWVRKGYVRHFAKTSNCGAKCQQCQPETVELYEWVLPTS